MTVQEAKETVVLAGRKLVESGLIARTWGNVSCRISSTHFVITPSGRDYLSLTPDQIVEVAIEDLSYSGSIKPSSEKGVHAEVYKLHPEVNFVIHTHQDLASAVSVLNLDVIRVSNSYPTLRQEVICAGYGLPGTKKLRRNAALALARSKSNAVIMKNHGTICFGADYEEAFQTAKELEAACEDFIREQFKNTLNISLKDPVKAGCLALARITKETILTAKGNTLLPCESERTDSGFRISIGSETYEVSSDRYNNAIPADKDLISEIQLHSKIYKRYTNINSILHTDTPGITAVSCTGMKMLPLLDDYAQIAGSSVHTAGTDSKDISDSLKHSPAVFIPGNGALCTGITKSDAEAVSLVTEKNCYALILAALMGKVKYIKPIECRLMRFVYLKKYSKQVYKK